MIEENKIKIIGLTVIASLIVFFAATHGVVSQQNSPIGINKELSSAPSGTAQALEASAPSPKFVQIQFLSELPVVSPEELQRREEMLGKNYLSVPSLPQENTPVGPSGGETSVANLQQLQRP